MEDPNSQIYPFLLVRIILRTWLSYPDWTSYCRNSDSTLKLLLLSSHSFPVLLKAYAEICSEPLLWDQQSAFGAGYQWDYWPAYS